jgi:hypothetical protein
MELKLFDRLFRNIRLRLARLLQFAHPDMFAFSMLQKQLVR